MEKPQGHIPIRIPSNGSAGKVTTASLGSSASQLALPGPFPIRPGPSAGPPGKWKLSEMALRRSHTPHTRRPSLQPPGLYGGCMVGYKTTSWGLSDGRIMCSAELLTIPHHHTHSDIASTVLYGAKYKRRKERVVVKGWQGRAVA
ncbi:hypothetical protein V499_04954 [Pseudogymnoascus sp. VKM F-103]|nr:hypothetical protein V499_04954 [Pseudogymnoascus sp. VKM F-103]